MSVFQGRFAKHTRISAMATSAPHRPHRPRQALRRARALSCPLTSRFASAILHHLCSPYHRRFAHAVHLQPPCAPPRRPPGRARPPSPPATVVADGVVVPRQHVSIPATCNGCHYNMAAVPTQPAFTSHRQHRPPSASPPAACRQKGLLLLFTTLLMTTVLQAGQTEELPMECNSRPSAKSVLVVAPPPRGHRALGQRSPPLSSMPTSSPGVPTAQVIFTVNRPPPPASARPITPSIRRATSPPHHRQDGHDDDVTFHSPPRGRAARLHRPLTAFTCDSAHQAAAAPPCRRTCLHPPNLYPNPP